MSVAGVPLGAFSFTTANVAASGKVVNRRQEQAWGFTEDLGGVMLEMVEVPGGEFFMGTSVADATTQAKECEKECERTGRSKANCERWVNMETPQHAVHVPNLVMGRYEVTQAQWRAVAKLPKVKIDLSPEPAYFKGSNLPVEQVNWEEAAEFCERLGLKTGRAYRLPTEAEWEYAARAGTTTLFAFGVTITPEIMNYDGHYLYGGMLKGSYREKTVLVGSLGVANAFGLFDLHGNVWEWCQDVWNDDYSNAPRNGSARLSGEELSYRVLRGGSWPNIGWICHSAYRYYEIKDTRNYTIGFRVVVSARTK
jgi:formylglycine-generating enzyme required for sulfatase activity